MFWTDWEPPVLGYHTSYTQLHLVLIRIFAEILIYGAQDDIPGSNIVPTVSSSHFSPDVEVLRFPPESISCQPWIQRSMFRNDGDSEYSKLILSIASYPN